MVYILSISVIWRISWHSFWRPGN